MRYLILAVVLGIATPTPSHAMSKCRKAFANTVVDRKNEYRHKRAVLLFCEKVDGKRYR